MLIKRLDVPLQNSTKVSRSLLTKLLLPIIFLQLTACNHAPIKPTISLKDDTQNTFKYLSQYIREQMKQHEIVGLSIAVLDDQNVVWEQGFGYADKVAKTPATPHTRYRAGSISKVLTATAIMQLAETGKIDIDAPLVKVLPNFAIQSHDANIEPITPRMVMTHHAGLPADYMEGMWVDHPGHFTSVVEVLHQEYRTFAPNMLHAYSNLGFTLLGATIEQVCGMPYETYMQSHLLAPLRMNDSSFETAAPTGDGAALAYDSKGNLTAETGLRDTPAGGLNTTVLDLVHFGSLWFADAKPNEILSSKSLQEMKSPQNAASLLDADLRVGLGWHLTHNAVNVDDTVLVHNGATINYRAILLVSPEEKVAVAVMANSANGMQSIDDIGKMALKLFAKKKNGLAQKLPNPVNHYPPAPPEDFAGHYAANELGLVEVKSKQGRLSVDIAGKSLSIKRLPNGYMGLEYQLLGLFSINLGHLSDLEFTLANIAGRKVLLARSENRFYLAGEKISPKPIDSDWTVLLGEYQYVGSDKTVAKAIKRLALKVEKGFLLASIHTDEGEQKLAFEPINNHQAVLSGLGRGRGETITFTKVDDDAFFQYEGLKFKKATSLKR
ncbi:MAG: serine hydrolase domain-containing protein [Methylophilus sp.]|nr:serine hydrolase domain-containing protein [Methylophilus sp.]